MGGHGQCDSSAASPKIQDAAGLVRRETLQSKLNKQFGFRARNQDGWRYDKIQAKELAFAEDVGYRLASFAAGDESFDGSGLGGRRYVTIVGQKPGTVDAEGAGRENLRFQPCFAPFQTECRCDASGGIVE
jgi:hypothetical protein